MNRHQRRRPSGRLAGIALLAIYALAVAAPFAAPYDFARQHRDLPFAPPTQLHFFDSQGTFHWRPFVYALSAGPDGEFREDRGRRFPVRFLIGDPESGRRLFGVEAPGRVFLLGSDRFGRDVLSRCLYGARISLFAGLLAGLLAVGLGLAVGAVAGYFGGWVDGILMRAGELFMALPWLYLLIGVRAFLPLHISPAHAFMLLVALIALVGWAPPARLVRGVVAGARERDYVLAARGFGASELYLLTRHVLPQAYPVALTQLALRVPSYILAEVTLSFLGLGVAEPVPSWGNMLAALEQYHVLVSYWWMSSPALALVVVVWCYYSLASAWQQRLGQAAV